MRIIRMPIVFFAIALSLFFVYPKVQFAQKRETRKQSVRKTLLQEPKRDQKPAESETSEAVLDVTFDEPLRASDILHLLSSKDVNVERLFYRWGEHSGWYSLGDHESLKEALESFSRGHEQFLRRQIIEFSARTMPLDSLVDAQARQQLQESKTQVAQEFADQLVDFQNHGLSISGFIVKSNRKTLQAIVKELPKHKATTRIAASGESNIQSKADSVANQSIASAGTCSDPDWKFSPSSGVISYDEPSKRFTSTFYWTNVSGFNSTHSAYEHNIVIYAQKGTYVKPPDRGLYYSNLPSWYVDSTAFDTFASFTIGSGKATAIKKNYAYYTDQPVEIINDQLGPESGDVQAQLGSWAGVYDSGWNPLLEPLEVPYCIAGGLTYANCIFPDATHPINDYYPPSGSSSGDFQFDHRYSSRYSWSKFVKTPTINPGSLTSLGPVTATISTTTHDAIIRYTTNGLDPSVSSPVYSSPLTFTSSVTLKARAFKNCFSDSAVATATYTIQPSPLLPTITRYDWDRIPIANQPFNGTIIGTNFTVGGTSVFFCVNGSNTCYQHPAAGVDVTSVNNITLTSVNLSAGSWQIYVKTQAGASAKSLPFTVQSPGPLPTISNYNWDRTPTSGQSFNGTITGTNFVVNGTSVFFCVSGTNTCYQHPAAGVNVTSSNSLNVTNVNLSAGSWQIYIQTSAGASAKSAAFTVQAPTSPPTISGYNWDRTPIAGQSFNGTITGTNFVVNGTSVFFCVNGTNTCYQHPAAGVNVTSSTSLSLSNVNLGAGSWQIYLQTAAGSSAKSAAFTVQSPPSPPTITGYSWDRTPIAGQAFNGTITGTNFVIGGTSVFFCVNGSSTCYQHPAAGVNVTSSTSLTVTNVNLGAGSWQIYVQTSAGSSARSSSFTVQSPPSPPTISSYSWDRTPTAGQSFNGTISGTNFIVGGTSVFFCITGSNTCYQHPAAGVSVSSAINLSVNNVNLSAGSWQVYLMTSAGQSARSSSFTVQTGPPTITGYSWTSTPTGGQPFNGTITGTNFVIGGTSVFFCIYGSATCYQHPSAGVSVTNTTSLNVSNVNLSTGSWQIYLQTSAGQSPRSTAFTVR